MKRIQKTDTDLDRLFQSLLKIRSDVLESKNRKSLDHPIHFSYQKSAQNLFHYLALRQKDILPIQVQLSEKGLSSLGRSEKHVLQSIDSVLAILARLTNSDPKIFEDSDHLDFKGGNLLLEQHTNDLFGTPAHGRKGRIMVTLPSEAAQDSQLIYSLIEKGMDCARINCSHDDEKTWKAMIRHIQKAENSLKKKCLILMDLPGEKIRTGPIHMEPEVIKLKPLRDVFGRTIRAAQVRLVPRGGFLPEDSLMALPIPQSWLQKLKVGDHVSFSDTRRAIRKIIITKVEAGGYLGECKETAYLSKNTVLKCKKKKEFKITHFHPTEDSITLFVGDKLKLTSDSSRASASRHNTKQKQIKPATVGCTSSRIFPFLSKQDRVLFDDGKITGVIQSTGKDSCDILITQAKAKGSRLRAEKGINLPDTDIPPHINSLVDDELLEFVSKNADLIALSFIKSEKDLEQILCLCEAAHLPVIWATQVLENLAKKGCPTRAEVTDASMAQRAECVMLNKGPYILFALDTLTKILHKTNSYQDKKKSLLNPLILKTA